MNKPAARTHGAVRTRGAVIVTRVSGHEQAEKGTSLENQTEACRTKALALSLPIIAEYEDAAISGAFLLARPGMQAALADIRAGRADTLITFNISRYSRDREHQEQIKKAVRAAGGRLVFTDADYTDNAAGNLNFNIQGDFAVYEREHFREKGMDGRRKRAEEGRQPSRRTSPYGYHIVSHTDVIRELSPAADVGRYIVREDQAKVARWIWAAYHTGTHSLAGIARQLTQEGVPTPGRAKHWGMTTVRYILSSPVYKGMAVYGRHDNVTDETRLLETHWRTGEPLKEPRRRSKADPDTWITMECPALVTEEVWDAVQVRLTDNKAKKGGNPQRVRMLAGRVLCPYCGASLACGSTKRRSRQGESTEARQRYTCGHYMKSVSETGTPGCLPTSYFVSEVEEAVLASILDAAQRPEAVAAALAAYTEAPAAESGLMDARRELAAVDKALAALAKEEAATVQAQIQGIMQGAPPDAYAAAFADLAGRRKDMEDRRGALSRRVQEAPGRKAAEAGEQDRSVPQGHSIPLDRQALADAAQVLTSPEVSGADKRDALACLIESVTPCRKTVGMETEVIFLPGVLGAETLHTMRLGSDSTRALFSVTSASSWAASGRMRFRGPPPVAS